MTSASTDSLPGHLLITIPTLCVTKQAEEGKERQRNRHHGFQMLSQSFMAVRCSVRNFYWVCDRVKKM